MTLKLVIGNKNYSSWSMRPWLALRASGIAFEEIFVPHYTDNKADKERLLSFSASGLRKATRNGATSRPAQIRAPRMRKMTSGR